nr:MAG TPA: hypothetical protein [Caudoviricetes sp.]
MYAAFVSLKQRQLFLQNFLLLLFPLFSPPLKKSHFAIG